MLFVSLTRSFDGIVFVCSFVGLRKRVDSSSSPTSTPTSFRQHFVVLSFFLWVRACSLSHASVVVVDDFARCFRSYLWLPPCEWGSADEGMLPPPVLQLDSNLTSVKRTNSTVGHTGVMAIWQARGAYVV